MPGTPPKYNLPTSSFKNYKKTKTQDSILKRQAGEEYIVNPGARVYPYNYTPKFSKYGFLKKQKDENQLLGVAGFGFPRKGINLDFVGIKPLDNNPYFKGVLGGGVSKQIGDLNIGASVDTAITGYPDRSGNFIKDKTKLNPKLKLKYNFKNGGAMAPIIPTWDYPSEKTFVKDTTDAPPRIFEGGGGFNRRLLSLPEIDTVEGTNRPIQNLNETTVYKSQESKKRQYSLSQKLDQLKHATKKYYKDRGFGSVFLKQNKGNRIETLQENVNQYKENLKNEKQRYSRAESALSTLQKKNPEEWKDKKLKDVISSQGIEGLRKLYKNDDISDTNFMSYYNSFGKDFDRNVKEGSKGGSYNAKEAREKWEAGDPDGWKNFISMVNKAAIAAPLLGAAGVLAPGAPAMTELGLSGARYMGQAGNSLWNNAKVGMKGLSQPFVGSTNALGMYSGAAPGLQFLTPGLLIEGGGAAYLGHELGDPTSNMRNSWRELSEKGMNIDTVGNALYETTLPFLGASSTFSNVMKPVINKVVPAISSASKLMHKIPQLNSAGAGIKQVWNKPGQWNKLLKEKSLFRFEGDATKVGGRFYQSSANADIEAYKRGNPLYRRFSTTEAAAENYNLKSIHNKIKGGQKVSPLEKQAVERSMAPIDSPEMQTALQELSLNSKEAAEVKELVSRPNDYWNLPSAKKYADVLEKLPPNSTEYYIPTNKAFSRAAKTKDLNFADKFNYFDAKNLGTEFRIGSRGTKEAVERTFKAAEGLSVKLGKLGKLGKLTGKEETDE